MNLPSRIRELFWHTTIEEAPRTPGKAQLFESGEPLILRVVEAIRLRRSVLITGPRGSGKSYCADKGIERAKELGLIGGSHFLQGNREISRDYLSEDTMVIRDRDRRPTPELLDALVVRPPQFSHEQLVALRTHHASEHFPGVASVDRDGTNPLWTTQHWTVLFLDEINRFGDGFLDSLLSLTEERKIVRGGIKLFVPIIVVATANPPGYDITAKKLSPPLQARISRSYRVSQPSLPAMVYRVLPDQLKRYQFEYPGRPIVVEPALRKRVAGAALCLWGNPDLERKGMGFLTAGTRALLASVCETPELDQLLRALGELVSFGPDARSVGDWIGCAIGIASLRKDAAITVTVDDLLQSALEVLAHKVRENFNEGTEPTKVAEKEALISAIVRRALVHPALGALFEVPYEAAVHALVGIDMSPHQAVAAPQVDAKLELALAAIDRLSAPEHRAFITALVANVLVGDAPIDAAICSAPQLELLRAIALDADAAGLAEERAHVVGWITRLSKRASDPVKAARALLGARPELSRWTAPVLDTARANSTASLGDCSDWLSTIGIVAEALQHAPSGSGAGSHAFPMLADLLAQRQRRALTRQALPHTVAELVRERTTRTFGLVPRTPRAKDLVADTYRRVAREVTLDTRPYVDAVFAEIAALG